MPQFISPPPMILQQPMTGYTQWNTPMGVVPLVGYPSAYPHVVDMTRRSYAAEVLSPEVYQAMAYRPAAQPQQPAPTKKAPAKRRAGGGGQSQTTQSAGTPNAPGTSPIQLAPSHTHNKYNVLKPAHSATTPVQPVQIIPPVAPARASAQTPVAAPVAATLDAIRDYVPADYILGGNPTSTLRPSGTMQRAASPIDAVLSATSEYVPAGYILGGMQPVARRGNMLQMPAQQTPIDATIAATSDYVPGDVLLGGDVAEQYRAGINRIMNMLGRKNIASTQPVQPDPIIQQPVEAPVDEPVSTMAAIAPAAAMPSAVPAMYPVELESMLGVPAPIPSGNASAQVPGTPPVIPEAEGVFGIPTMRAPVAQGGISVPLAAGQDIPALVVTPESDGRYEGEVMRMREALRNYRDLLQLF